MPPNEPPRRAILTVSATHLTDGDGRYATIILGHNAEPRYPKLILVDFETDFIGSGQDVFAMLEKAKREFWESNSPKTIKVYTDNSLPRAVLISNLPPERPPMGGFSQIPAGMRDAAAEIVSWVAEFVRGGHVEIGGRAAAKRGKTLLDTAGQLKAGEAIADNLLAWTFVSALAVGELQDLSGLIKRVQLARR